MPDESLNQETTPPAGTPPAAPPAPAPDWTASLPESLREMGKGAGSLEALGAALKHGLAHAPVAKAEEVEVTAPEGVPLDEAATGWFKKAAVDLGFSKGQIQGLVKAYNAHVAAQPELLKTATEKQLRAEFGPDYEARIAKAEDAAKRLDAMCNGALGKVLAMGLGNHPDFIKAMMVIGESVSSSALPGHPLSGSGHEAMSSEEFLNNVFNVKQGA